MLLRRLEKKRDNKRLQNSRKQIFGIPSEYLRNSDGIGIPIKGGTEFLQSREGKFQRRNFRNSLGIPSEFRCRNSFGIPKFHSREGENSSEGIFGIPSEYLRNSDPLERKGKNSSEQIFEIPLEFPRNSDRGNSGLFFCFGSYLSSFSSFDSKFFALKRGLKGL